MTFPPTRGWRTELAIGGCLYSYLSKASDFLTPAERAELPFAGKLITLEQGIRFLTDFLDGDVYFKTTKRPTFHSQISPEF